MALQRLQPKKGSVALYLILLGACVLLFLGLKQCSVKYIGDRPDLIAGGDTLNIAIEVGPFGVIISGDTLSGPYYNLLREAGARAGLPMRFHPYTRLVDALEWLENGKCRLVVGDIPVTTELKERYAFIEPGVVDRLVLVQPRDSAGNIAVATQTDLAHRTVWVTKGSPAILRLENLAHEIGDTIIVREEPEYGATELVVLASLGELPGGMAVVSRVVADSIVPRYKNLDSSVEISFNQFRGWATLPKDSLLRDSITALIAPLRN